MNLFPFIKSSDDTASRIEELEKKRKESLENNDITQAAGIDSLLDKERRNFSTTAQFFKELPKAAWDTTKDILRAGPRAAASVTSSVLGRDKVMPVTTAEKFLWGSNEIKSLNERQKESSKQLKDLGFGKASGPLAASGVLLSTVLDIIPGTGSEEKSVKKGIESGSKSIFKELSNFISNDDWEGFVKSGGNLETLRKIQTSITQPESIKKTIDYTIGKKLEDITNKIKYQGSDNRGLASMIDAIWKNKDPKFYEDVAKRTAMSGTALPKGQTPVQGFIQEQLDNIFPPELIDLLKKKSLFK